MLTVAALAAGAGCGASSSNPPSAHQPNTSHDASTAASSTSAKTPAGSTPAKIGKGELFLPEGWSAAAQNGRLNIDAPQGSYLTKPGTAAFASGATPRANTEEDAKGHLTTFRAGGYQNVKRLPDVTYGGVTFYHIQAENAGAWIDDFGAVHDGYATNVWWTFLRGVIDRKGTAKLIDQVMPTFKAL